MKILGLINARGGSKGIPRKNIKPLNGKPLISWTIDAALESEYISRLVVSTDDEEIANVARTSGADVPFIRPDYLASDKSIQIDSVKHAINFLEESGEFFEYVVILQPTVPLRSTEDIDGSINLLLSNEVDSVITICDIGGRHPLTCYENIHDDNLKPLYDSDAKGVLRQEFKEILWRNGAVYAMSRDTIMIKNSLYGDSIMGYRMPEERSFNVDSIFDWNILDSYIKYHK